MTFLEKLCAKISIYTDKDPQQILDNLSEFDISNLANSIVNTLDDEIEDSDAHLAHIPTTITLPPKEFDRLFDNEAQNTKYEATQALKNLMAPKSKGK